MPCAGGGRNLGRDPEERVGTDNVSPDEPLVRLHAWQLEVMQAAASGRDDRQERVRKREVLEDRDDVVVALEEGHPVPDVRVLEVAREERRVQGVQGQMRDDVVGEAGVDDLVGWQR